ncbi:DUF962-domain-containing protein [Calocera viscosa TUFC12733]|uniref:DUF962-domain-containing protein n=1 Tax=Calocera viscosa (strain TUFC12733) TaxID=1330018 RepID=A0A167KMY3_CALVF|nr:DUF962-domain-containing protein [Calocera viscosa TUFC12733]
MYAGHLLSIRDQLVGYGAYHSHPVNIVIHRIFVPLIVWSFGVLFSQNLAPQLSYKFNGWLQFDANVFIVYAAGCLVYFYTMEPLAALLITPQWVLIYLTGCAFSYRPHAMAIAAAVNIVSWIAQFIGHGEFEGRSPALVDNLVGALVLAPFFVHLENLFDLGYRKDLHKSVQAGVQEKRAEFAAKKARKANGTSNGKSKDL